MNLGSNFTIVFYIKNVFICLISDESFIFLLLCVMTRIYIGLCEQMLLTFVCFFFKCRFGLNTRKSAYTKIVRWEKQFLNATIVDVVMCFFLDLFLQRRKV